MNHIYQSDHPPNDVNNFFHSLWGDQFEGYLVIAQLHNKIFNFASSSQLEEYSNQIADTCETKDVHFGLGLLEKAPDKGRGKKEDIIALPGFWADIDVGHEGHKSDQLPPDIKTAMGLLARFPLNPTLIINSGNGLHLYWLFKEPWYFKSNDDREKAQLLSKEFHTYLINKAAQMNFKMDNTSDITRLLRVPGTKNHKTNPPKAVEIISDNSTNDDFRYSIEDFENLLITPKTNSQEYDSAYSSESNTQFEPITKRCKWVKHCKKDSILLDEPEWYHLLTVIARCFDPIKNAHKISMNYQGYTPEETEEKLSHAANSPGPVTCSYVNENFKQTKFDGKLVPFCKTCKYLDKITSPIQLGHDSSSDIDPDELEPPCDPIYADWIEDFHETSFFVNKEGHLCSIDSKGEDIIDYANFIARPSKEVIVDNGIEQVKYFEIEGLLESGVTLPTVNVKAEDFPKMDWILQEWGIKANLSPFRNINETIRFVIQLLGRKATVETIYSHMGWRKIEGTWCYLHSKGGIGIDNVKVSTDSFLDSYYLPSLDESSISSMKTSLNLLHLAKKEITFPLASLVYLAPLCEFLRIANHEPNFVLWVHGRTGSRKTSLATLFLSHFKEYSASPPATFKDTVNALERKAFHCKDSILLIDDYHPSSSKYEAEKMNQTAQYLVRLYGDKIGKGRMKADTSMRKEYPPRGLAIVTGEDFISGHSSSARCYSVEIGRFDVDLEKLTAAQNEHQKLSQAMLGYIQWLLPQADTLPAMLKEDFMKLRDSLQEINTHGRTMESIAWLQIGFKYMMEYAKHLGLISSEDADKMFDVSLHTFIQVAETQNEDIEHETPEKIFLQVFKALIDSKEYHLDVSKTKSSPQDLISPSDKLLGWEDEEYYYLQQDNVYNAVCSFLSKQGRTFPVSLKALLKMLDEAGLIKTEKETLDDGSIRVQRTIKKTVYNKRYRLLFIIKSKLNQYLEL